MPQNSLTPTEKTVLSALSSGLCGEKYLAEKFNFSFVSIISKGNSLILNVKEELPNITETYESIIAPYNMIIKIVCMKGV